MSEEGAADPKAAEGANSDPFVQAAEVVGSVQGRMPSTEQQLTDVKREMNAFERSTLNWTRAQFGILAITGFFISLQWCEMRSGGADTHELAVAATKQAKAAKTLAEQAKAQTDKMGESLTKTDALIQKATEQAIATNSLAREAKRSADIAQARQAPWLGIEEPTTMPVDFSYLWPARSPIPYPTLDVDVNFSIKNYGPSPAYLLRDSAMNLNLSTNLGSDQPSIRETCGIDAFRTPGQVALPADFGEMILPGTSKPFRGGTVTSFKENTPKELRALSFTICLVYQDQSGRWRYSGYRYTAWAGAIVAVPNHLGWSYARFNRGAFLTASKAE